MSTTGILIIVGGFVIGFLVVTFLMKVAKDAKELGKDTDDGDDSG